MVYTALVENVQFSKILTEKVLKGMFFGQGFNFVFGHIFNILGPV